MLCVIRKEDTGEPDVVDLATVDRDMLRLREDDRTGVPPQAQPARRIGIPELETRECDVSHRVFRVIAFESEELLDGWSDDDLLFDRRLKRDV